MILFFISLIAGILTILAPCTLPLLPVIVGSSVVGTGNTQGTAGGRTAKKSQRLKALTISLSLGASVVLFTLLLKFSTSLIQIPAFVWTLVSGSIIIIFGITSLFPNLWEKIPGMATLSTRSNRLLGVGYKRKGFVGDIIIGASLGPVFSTCSPTYFIILATVLPQSFLLGLVYLIAYAVGLGGMIMLVSILGQKIVGKLGGLADSGGVFKRSLGVLFIILGILIIFGVDKVAERKLLDSGIFDITKIERSLLSFNSTNSIDVLKNLKPEVCEGSDGKCASKDQSLNGLQQVDVKFDTQKGDPYVKVEDRRLSGLPIAPELVSPSGFINTGGKPIHIADYKGKKVILLDVWTYSCINCQRTLPYVNAWYDKYKDQGLEIIGLHTPEFGFEKVQSNVEREVKKFGIKYPVVMDNEYGTWNAYGNSYWPRKYLINEYGEIIYDHIGEGDYEEIEMQIQKALAKLNSGADGSSGTVVSEDASGGAQNNSMKKPIITSASIGAGNITDPKNKIEVDSTKVQSPEIYFGYNRNGYLANGKVAMPGEQSLVAPKIADIESNKLYLGGVWNFESEYVTTNADTAAQSDLQPKILFKYEAKNVYMVLSGKVGVNSVATPAQISVYVDGVKTKAITVKDQQLYTVVEGKDYGIHTVELRVESGELNAYTFTFG